MILYKTIIIGGGAAGLFCGANLKGKNNLLLEGEKKIGQKLLITGGGMCNITNMDITEDFLTRFADKKRFNFLKAAMLNFPTDKTRNWLESIGLDIEIRDDGKVFPESRKAQSLINILQKEISNNGTLIKYNTKVISISFIENIFKVTTCSEIFECKNIILATGGKSFPETGSDGSGYKLAEIFKHKIISPTPALTGVKISNYPFKSLSGNSVKSSMVDFFRNGETKRYLTTTGDILFTHQGLSGPGILNTSRQIQNGDLLNISIIPCSNKEEKRVDIIELINSSGKKTVKKVLKELGLTSSMACLLSSYLKIDQESQVKSLHKKIKTGLINHILNFPFKISCKIGFNAAMVTAGGVDISEINRKTMESKLIPGLYFAGEIMDIDGDTGGYNIQAAFSTAKLITDTLNP